jgi:small subunit ribosomal protein S4
MGRLTGPKNRLSRREGIDLFGKGNKLRRADQVPGQHGPKGGSRGPKRLSGFGVQLREKQKTKRMYGIMEKQFRKYFEKAAKSRGSTGEILLQLLEVRLDNAVYRLGLVPTRNMARQIVGHGHVRVNGQKVTIPSYQVRVGDEVTLLDSALNMPVVKARLENKDLPIPGWLTREGAAGKIVSLPLRPEIDSPVSEQLIVEYYSR